MSNTQHTPLPWKGYNGTIISKNKETIVAPETGTFSVGYKYFEANAAFIVRACNNHYKLIDALEGLLNDIQEYQKINNLGGEDNHWQVIARKTLAQAKGEA